MIVVWGSYGLKKTFKNLFPVYFCGFCNFHGKMECVTTARLAHFCFIPLFVYSREYFLTCPNCGNVIKISKDVFKRIKNGSWQPSDMNPNNHVLTKEEIFIKVVTQEVRGIINSKLKQLQDPLKRQASAEKIMQKLRSKYENNEIVLRITEDMLSTVPISN